MKKMLMTAAMVLAAGVGQAQAATVTIATFSDPSPGSGTPVFTATNTGGDITLNGGWTGTGLNLQLPADGLSYANAQFSS